VLPTQNGGVVLESQSLVQKHPSCFSSLCLKQARLSVGFPLKSNTMALYPFCSIESHVSLRLVKQSAHDSISLSHLKKF